MLGPLLPAIQKQPIGIGGLRYRFSRTLPILIWLERVPGLFKQLTLSIIVTYDCPLRNFFPLPSYNISSFLCENGPKQVPEFINKLLEKTWPVDYRKQWLNHHIKVYNILKAYHFSPEGVNYSNIWWRTTSVFRRNSFYWASDIN